MIKLLLWLVSPIVFTDIEGCKSLLLANRSDILSKL